MLLIFTVNPQFHQSSDHIAKQNFLDKNISHHKGWKAVLISITWCSGLYDIPDGARREVIGTPLIISVISPLTQLDKPSFDEEES